MKSQVFFKHNAKLGEGIHWDEKKKLIWFVDIHSRKLFSLTLNKKLTSYQLDQKIGWVITVLNKDYLMIGLEEGIALFDPRNNGKIICWVKKFNENKNLRLNDAKADKFGNIWGGTLNDDDESKDDGFFFVLKNNGDFKIIEKNYYVPNGPIIIHEESSILHTDSLKKTIFKYKIDFKNLRVLKKNVFKKFFNNDGYPDGMTHDRDGNIYIAMWGEGKIRKFDHRGKQLGSVALPAKNITNVCFGGEGLNRLFATSSKSSDEELGGSIFEILNHGSVGFNPYKALSA